MTLDKTVVSNVIADNRNSFITVKFLTKSDEERTYNGRMNVQKDMNFFSGATEWFHVNSE